MDLQLTGKVALISGASRGIGLGIANVLGQEGANLVICARKKEALEKAASELKNNNIRVLPVQLDIAEESAAGRLVELSIREFGRIDILVNSAGSNRRNLFVDTKEEDWNDIIELNFNAHRRMSQSVVPVMKQSGGGSIIFITSIFGREAGGAGLSIYNSTKSALISLAKIMAMELAADKIRVNSVAPGSIRFPDSSWDKRVKENPDAMAKFVEDNIPIGRFGTVEEVANVVAFLASEKASLVTGTCINVDGCQSKSLI